SSGPRCARGQDAAGPPPPPGVRAGVPAGPPGSRPRRRGPAVRAPAARPPTVARRLGAGLDLLTVQLLRDLLKHWAGRLAATGGDGGRPPASGGTAGRGGLAAGPGG